MKEPAFQPKASGSRTALYCLLVYIGLFVVVFLEWSYFAVRGIFWKEKWIAPLTSSNLYWKMFAPRVARARLFLDMPILRTFLLVMFYFSGDLSSQVTVGHSRIVHLNPKTLRQVLCGY